MDQAALIGLTTFVAVAIAIAVRYNHLAALPLCMPPGGSWLWGHEKLALQEDSGDYYLRYFDEFGPAFKARCALGQADLLHLADPAAISHIFVKKNYDYPHSSYIQPMLGNLLGESVLWADGDTHIRMRRFLNPAFSADRIRVFGNELVDTMLKFESQIFEALAAEGGSTIINLKEWIWRPMLDVIGKAGFGHDFGCGNSVDAQAIMAAQRKQNRGATDPSVVLAAAVARLMPWIVKLPLPAFTTVATTKRSIHRLAGNILNQRQDVEGRDLLSVLLREVQTRDETTSSTQMLNHMSTFVTAAFDTVATVAGTSLWALGQNPEVQEKLRQEALAFTGTPSFDDLMGQSLPYLDAVCKESLRLYQASVYTERVALHDDVLPLKFPVRATDGSYLTSIPIRKGQIIVVSGSAVDRLKCVWGDDASKFRPERWLDPDCLPPKTSMNGGWGGLFAFSQGPRNCIGWRLAVFELKFVIFSFIRKFKVADTGDCVIRVSSALNLIPQPFVVGKENQGVCLPVHLSVVDDTVI